MTRTTASSVLMVPPEHFAFNQQTALSNVYQKKLVHRDVRKQAMKEFHGMVDALREEGIEVIEFRQPQPLPDAVFPNNWFSTHLNETGGMDIILYPMLTENRQQEVVPDLLIQCLKAHGVEVDQIKDLRLQNSGALEGTGSVILDRASRKLYAALSPRTEKEMVGRLADELDYEPIIFHSVDPNGQAIYHSNVMMSVARAYAILCMESIKDEKERQSVIHHLEASGKQIIDISYTQLRHMCANALELLNAKGEAILVLSKQAYSHFTAGQRQRLESHAKLLPLELDTIETVGGGSARCMMAELFAHPVT